MPKSQSTQHLLAQAEEKEKKYDWIKAAELYEQSHGIVGKTNFFGKGEIQEKIGYCLYRFAFQVESQEEFKERMQRAVEAYEKARGLYDKLAGEQKAAWIFRCDAMIAYMGYWLVSDVPEKKRLIDACWRLAKEALRAFEEANDAWEYGKTYNQLSMSTVFGFFFEWDPQVRKNTIIEAVENGERAIKFLSTCEDFDELARAYVKTATSLQVLAYHFVGPVEKSKYSKKAAGYWLKANETSEEMAMLELISVGQEQGFDWGEGANKALVNFKKALEYGRKTRDQFIIGCALDWLAYHTSWRAFATEDQDRRVELFKRALQYAEDAKHHYSPISFISPRGGMCWTQAPYAEHYFFLARFETNLSKRRELLEKAVEAAPDLLKRAENSGYPEAILYANHVFSSILWFLAKTEMNSEEKKKLLEKALRHGNESMRLIDQLQPFAYWNRGINQGSIARIKSELAGLAKDPETKKTMLQEAIRNADAFGKLCIKHLRFYENEASTSMFAVLGIGQYEYGDLLSRFIDDRKKLRKAIEIFEWAAESFQKPNMMGRVAECHWKIAQICEKLGEHSKAAENFELASNNYKSAAEKIPQLRDFYMDHALYMQAWSEIELAKHHHVGKRYDEAKLHYEKSASLHKSTEHWTYLGSNYDAWARLEEAEDLSRKEQTEEARDLFQKAADLFVEAKQSINAKLEEVDARDEKEMATELAKASETRHEYCLGRAVLEEAKTFDRQGDHATSSRKYGNAIENFQKAVTVMEHESDRQELKPIIDLTRAWQLMTRAEAEVSPVLYLEAAELFEEAKEHSIDEKAKVLALGHSSFCKALEAGTRFEATRDMALYSTTKKHLEAAENYYLKADFKNASEYAKATHKLFDAYMYAHRGETETEPRNKSRYYQMAEKLLQASAGSFMKAKHPEKSEEVQRLLDSVKEKRQLATSLTKVLHVPTITSTTTSFSTPNPTHEKAVGLERFEHADIQANLTASEEATVEEEVEVRLDLANVAKESGLLVRIDDLIPSGFKAVAPPSQYSIDDGSIDMKGKKLDPLKVETIKLNLRATKPGLVDLNPKVVYVDDVGEFRTCKADPVTVTVHPRLALEFKTRAAQDVFEYLVGSFVEDYMRRRLIVQEAGWRSFVQIIKNAKVSSRSVYGSRGSHGSAISELERRGLVEIRIFLGERGRGGKVVKARISYEKETVKRLVDQKVAVL